MNVINRFEEIQAKTSSPTKSPSTRIKAESSSGGPILSTSQQAATKNIYEVSTDDDDDKGTQLDEDGLPVLPDFFGGETFYLGGKFNDRRTLVRYIVAYNG